MDAPKEPPTTSQQNLKPTIPTASPSPSPPTAEIFLISYSAFILIISISAFASHLNEPDILHIIALPLIVSLHISALWSLLYKYKYQRLSWLLEAIVVFTTGILWPYYGFWLWNCKVDRDMSMAACRSSEYEICFVPDEGLWGEQ